MYRITIPQFLVFSFIVLLIIITSFCYLDKPIAIWFSQHMNYHQYHILKYNYAKILTQLFYFCMILVFGTYFILRLINYKKQKLMECLALLSSSVVFAYFIKANLQFIFGRYIPRYPERITLLFTRKPELYGFNWFHYGCFPSGHMAVFTALFVAISIYYPKFKYVGIGLLLILALLLLAMNYHFLSDIIAGTYLGLAITLGLEKIFKINNGIT